MASIVAVFNIANLDATIKASGPFLRIVACGLSYIESKAIMDSVPMETRMIPVSKGPSGPDGLGSVLYWRPISNLSFTGLSDTASNKVLNDEFDSIERRTTEWNAWRESIDQSVNDAARLKVMRPVYQVRAEYLLDYYFTTWPAQTPVSGVMSTTKIDRNLETTGHTWCLVAIMGSAAYEKRKSEILEGLGEAYYAMLKESASASGPSVEAPNEASDEANERLWFEKPNEALMTQFLENIVAPVAEALRQLPEEPLVAFFQASDDPDALNEKASWLSKAPELKHADIAVVRMYSWLNMRSTKNMKLKHISRGTNAQANDFFSAMRAAMSK